MGKLLEAYTTKGGKVFKKVKGKDGNTYHFKDGTPVTSNSFNGGIAHKAHDGQPTKVAIPSNKGPGYERVEVSHTESSNLGKELRLLRDDVRGTPKDKILIDGEQYNTYELAELNNKIIERHDSDAVMKY